MGKFLRWAKRVDWTDVLIGYLGVCLGWMMIAIAFFIVRVTFWGMPG